MANLIGKKFNEIGKYVAAICASPSVLGESGILQGKKATCYPGFESQLKGADIIEGENVVIDGNIITSRGPATAMEFALEIVKILKGEDVYKEVKAGLLF